jgi:hypothetical protein
VGDPVGHAPGVAGVSAVTRKAVEALIEGFRDATFSAALLDLACVVF